jgi:hypothetical protein
MRSWCVIVSLAFALLGCDDATDRELEISSLGEPATDVERVEVAYAYARQADDRLTAIDRMALDGEPELLNVDRAVAELDQLLAETGRTAPSPGALSAGARTAAFDARGEFLGDRTLLHMRTGSIEQSTDALFTQRDISRRQLMMFGGAGVLPLGGGLVLLILMALRKKRRPAPVSA